MNNFAISSGGIGDALLNSAAALSAAGNTLDESIAMIAAANETIQNPEKVGTALKTVSMYIRAAKTEAEEAGIATEGMADSVSELRQELLDLTGQQVDIMDGDNYKSTVQILRELSKVWDDLSDTTRTNIAEILGGGVRNSNVVFSLLQNFSTVEEVLEKTANSAGSALAENEKYLDSIAGKTAKFQAAFEELSTTAIESDTIKGFIDLGTDLLEIVTQIVDQFGLIPSLLGTIGTAMSVTGTESIVTPFTLVNGEIGYRNVDSSILRSIDSLKAFQDELENLDSTSSDFGKNVEDVFTKKLGTASVSVQDYGRTLVEAAKNGEAATNVTFGYTKALIKQEAATLAAHAGQILLNAAYSVAATAAISAVTYAIVGLITARKKEIQQAQEATEVYNDQVSSIDSYKRKVESLKDSLESGELSHEESIRVREQLLEIQDELVDKYGVEARSIDLLTISTKEANAELDKLAKTSSSKYLLQNAKLIEESIEEMEKARTYQVTDLAYNVLSADAKKAFEEMISTYDGIELIDNVGYDTKTLRVTAKNAEDAERIISSLYSDFRNLEMELNNTGETLGSLLASDSLNAWENILGGWVDELDTVFDTYQKIYEAQIQAKIASGEFTNAYGEKQNYHSVMEDIAALQKEYQKVVTDSYTSEAERDAALADILDKVSSAKESFIRLYGNSANNSFDRGVYEYMLDLWDAMDGMDIGAFVESLEDIPASPASKLTEEFGRMADEVDRAKDAITELDEKLSEPDYDTNYKKDVEYFKALQEEISAGRFGSKRYNDLTEYFGVSDKSTGEVKQWADATSKYYDEVGNNAEDFLATIQELNEAGVLARDVMSYDSATGEFWFDPTRISEAADALSGFTEDTLTNIINLIRTYIPDWIVTMPVRTTVEIDGNSTEMAFDMELSELQRIADANGIELAYDDNGAILNAEDLLKVIESLPEDTDIEIELNGETIKTIDAIKELVELVKYLKAQGGIAPTIDQSANLSTGINTQWQSDRFQMYATGSRSAYGGPALLGDEYSPTGSPKPELVISDGEAYLAGTNGPTLQNLKPGDRVYSYRDTKKILSGGKVDFKIPAFDGGKISFGSSGGTSAGTYTSTYDKETDKLHELYEKRIAELEHAIFLLEKNGASSDNIISVYNQLMQSAHEEADRLRALGVDDNDEMIINLQQQWWEYHDAIVDIEEEIRDARDETLENAKDATEELIEYRIDMIKQDLENQKEALNEELDALSDFYDEQRDMLQKAKDEEDYIKERDEKRKTVSDIQAELDMLRYNDSAWAQKRIAELQSQLADAVEERDEFEKEHALDQAIEMLDKQEEQQVQGIQTQIDALDAKLNDPAALYNQALADIQNNTLELYKEMVEFNNKYGSGNPEDILTMWNEAFQFFTQYIETYGEPYKGIRLTDVSGYASGTSHATAGLHRFDEEGLGSEYIFTSADGSRYRMFRDGDKVLNADGVDFLYKFAETHGGNVFNTVNDMINRMYSNLMNGLVQSRDMPPIYMGDIIIQGNADEKTVSEIRRENRNRLTTLLKELNRLK